MTIGELIKDKDYDYISVRASKPEKAGDSSVFIDVSASKNGVLLSLDGDFYSKETEVLSYEEWSNLENGINHGLTVVIKGEWL